CLEVEATERTLGGDGEKTDRGHRRSEPYAECENQDEPVADSVQRDRREQHDERGWARNQPAGDPDAKQLSHVRTRLVVTMAVMVVSIALMRVAVLVAVIMRVSGVHARALPVANAPAKDADPDADHEQGRDEVEPGVELLGNKKGGERQRHEPQR